MQSGVGGKTIPRRFAEADPLSAYYEEQRKAARSRAQSDARESWHWAKATSEVARIEPRAAMNFEIVKAISDQVAARRR